MDEPTAWMYQAQADRDAAERFIADNKPSGRCHAIAKWQQTVEKTIKAIVRALNAARILEKMPRAKHAVEPYIYVLIRLPRSPANKTIQNLLQGLLDQRTREGIRSLDALAPRMPPGRNTEYPFQSEVGQWTYPAADGIFSDQEVANFRALAHRVLIRAGRIISAISRRPK